MDKRFLILKRRHFFIIAAIAVAFLSFSLTAFAEDETIPDPAENIPNEVTPTPEPTPEIISEPVQEILPEVDSVLEIEEVSQQESDAQEEDLVISAEGVLVENSVLEIEEVSQQESDAQEENLVISAEDVLVENSEEILVPEVEVVPIDVPTPDILEELIGNTKIVTITLPEGVDGSLMINVPVKTAISEIFKVGQENQIKI